MRIQCHESTQQVKLALADLVLRVLLERDALELGEGRLEVGKLKRIWPVIIVRRTQYPEDFEDLVNLTVTHENRPLLEHLCKNAPRAPHVDAE